MKLCVVLDLLKIHNLCKGIFLQNIKEHGCSTKYTYIYISSKAVTNGPLQLCVRNLYADGRRIQTLLKPLLSLLKTVKYFDKFQVLRVYLVNIMNVHILYNYQVMTPACILYGENHLEKTAHPNMFPQLLAFP